MIQRIVIFLSLFCTVLIITTHWGSGSLVMFSVLVSLISSIGKKKNWLTVVLLLPIKFFSSANHPNKVNQMYTLTFFIIVSTNIIGLYTYNHHVLLSSVNLVLARVVLVLWIFSYRRYINRRWGHLTTTLIVNITYPSLSLLLRNIEILTHRFRPLTLIARIWVNMWVGHCILSIISFIFIKKLSVGFVSFSTMFLFPIAQSSLFLYELLIILLQSTVIVYLSFIYYRDNLNSTVDC